MKRCKLVARASRPCVSKPSHLPNQDCTGETPVLLRRLRLHRALFCSAICIAAFEAGSISAEDFLDRVDGALTFTGFNDQVRARLSGLIDLEGYYFH